VSLIAYKHSQNNTLGNPFAKYLAVALHRLCYEFNKLLVDFSNDESEEEDEEETKETEKEDAKDEPEKLSPSEIKTKLITLIHVI